MHNNVKKRLQRGRFRSRHGSDTSGALASCTIPRRLGSPVDAQSGPAEGLTLEIAVQIGDPFRCPAITECSECAQTDPTHALDTILLFTILKMEGISVSVFR